MKHFKKLIKRGFLVFTVISLLLISPSGIFAAGKSLKENQLPINKSVFVPGEVVVKFNDNIGNSLPSEVKGPVLLNSSSLTQTNIKVGASNLTRTFSDSKDKDEAKKLGLENVYKVKIPKDSDVLNAVSEYKKDSNVVWAEPNYLNFTSATPNDTNYNLQWALTKVQAPAAWDIQKGENGSPVPKIAIVDTGVDWNHVDLASNIWVNSADPINGIDDDHNGYVDDYRGWDFVNTACLGPGDCPIDGFDLICTDADYTVRDNNPDDSNGHGTLVSGVAGAVTNNSAGVAGISWNAKIMAVRAGYDASWDGYTHIGVIDDADAAAAIAYASDMGANVISMSWGGVSENNTIRDAINYANGKGTVMVAASGNDAPTPLLFYPAAYDQVISVTATDASDHFIAGWNYGSWIDVSAPGDNIYTTAMSDTYGYASGTSLATPHVAGVVALLKAKYPTWAKQAIVNRLINRTDYIDSSNPSYAQKMGRGRLNPAAALGNDYTHPDGTLIKTADSPNIYLLQGHKRLIPSWDVFSQQFFYSHVVTISNSEMATYNSGTKIKYLDGSLIKGSGSAIYVIEHGVLRQISDWSTFVGLGYNMSMVYMVSDSDLNVYYTTGNNWSDSSSHATGSLIKTSSSPNIYRLEDGQRRLIKSWDLFVNSGFSMNNVMTISDFEMSSYSNGTQIIYPDGSLLKGSGPEIYVVEYGYKRHISSWTQFVSLNYSLTNVSIVNDAYLNNDYATGSPI